jgi:hypothetical protein
MGVMGIVLLVWKDEGTIIDGKTTHFVTSTLLSLLLFEN